MASRSEKEEIHEGFQKELLNQIELLKKEFDGLQTKATFSFQMGEGNDEMKHLQTLKDTKIRLLRNRYHHEADMILREFTDKAQAVLDRDDHNVSRGGNLADSENSRTRGGRRRKEKKDEKENAEKENTRDKNEKKEEEETPQGDIPQDNNGQEDSSDKTNEKPTIRASGRQRSSKPESSIAVNNRAKKPVRSENSRLSLRRLKDDAKEPPCQSQRQPPSQCTEIEADSVQKVQKGKLGKVRIVRGGAGVSITLQAAEPVEDLVPESDPVVEESDSKPSLETENPTGDENPEPSTDTLQQPVRRSQRDRKKTSRLIERMGNDPSSK